MSMMVNFMGTREKATPQKNSNLGAKIGAGAGLIAGLGRTYAMRESAQQIVENSIAKGVSPKAVKIGHALGIIISLGLATGAGALIGKGVQKVINHFKKDKPEQPKDPFAPRTIKTKKDGEFVVVPGHPKTVYKKNPETGELEFVTQVYDGSWGKESSDEDLIKILTTKVKG